VRRASSAPGQPGYDGVEPYIDLNVFAGTREELEALALE
jgi:lysozyme